MITRRYLLLVVAATCLVTMVLTTTAPIFSLPYDPTVDVNHDAKIDGKDIASVALSYGTNGDPTVPVNVTNWPSGLTSGNVNVTNLPINQEGDINVNAKPRGNLTLCTDGQTITLIDTLDRGMPMIIQHTAFSDEVYMTYFAFSPKGKFNNVTRAIIQMVCNANISNAIANFSYRFAAHANQFGSAAYCFRTDGGYGIPTTPRTDWTIFSIDSSTFAILGPVVNWSGIAVLNQIQPGIVLADCSTQLLPSNNPYTITVYEVKIFIEYTYWDYVQ